ncbi:MAG: rod shape-determining protein RodA [Paludibacteraceae bacterium]
MSKNTNILRYLDWPMVLMYLALVLFGWLNVYGASHDIDQTSIFDFAYYSGKQLLWIVTALGLAGIVLLIDARAFQSLSMLLYAGMIVLLLVTMLVAPDVHGSRSWLKFGPISIQPAEFSKFITALALANVMGQYGFKLNSVQNYLKVCVLLFLPMLIIILQKETGSALVYVSFMLMLFREGLPGLIPFAALCCVVLFVVVIRFGALPFAGVESASMGLVIACSLIWLVAFVLMLKYRSPKMPVKWLIYGELLFLAGAVGLHFTGWIPVNFVYIVLALLAAMVVYVIVFAVRTRCPRLWLVVAFVGLGVAYCYSADYLFEHVLQPHQQARIEILLGMKDDPGGAGYNVQQAKIAIGSGGLIGKGFLNGTQTTLKFVPEQHTDFIFCTVGEEYGFVGAVLVLLLYTLFLFRLITLAERQHEAFARIYGYCVVGIFLFHVMVNVGMVIGLMPVIGIPLPFFSYGGSSLWSFTILLFIFLRLDIAQKQRAH